MFQSQSDTRASDEQVKTTAMSSNSDDSAVVYANCLIAQKKHFQLPCLRNSTNKGLLPITKQATIVQFQMVNIQPSR